MRFAGQLPAYYNQQYAEGGNPASFDTSSLPQQFGDVAGLAARAAARGGKFAESQAGSLPSLGSIQQKDPTNSWAMSAIEAGGRFFPHLGAAWLGINAGPTSTQDTLKTNPYYQQQQQQNR